MRECALCRIDCDSQIGYYDELKHVFWGGSRNGNVSYEEKRVYFFCCEEHRNIHLATGLTAGFEIQTEKWGNTGDD